MNHYDIESQLSQLGEDWPVDSVADAVSKRLESIPASQIVKPRSRRLQLTLAGSVLTLAVGAFIGWSTIVVAPTSLSAQVKKAIEKATSAHIVITRIDAKGVRNRGEIWYARERGFRLESLEEFIVDNGKQQWTWNSTRTETNRIVERRASRDGINMIAELMNLENVPIDWRQIRSSEFDRDLQNQHCEAYLIEPPATTTTSIDGISQNSFRIYAWMDAKHRIVRAEGQVKVQEKWIVNLEETIEYDVEIAAAKFAVEFPPDTKMIDADQRWASRFPLERSLAKAESGGLLFAVHEVARIEEDMFYVVSSARGTEEYLRQFPPTKRRLNFQLTVADVANQANGIAVYDLYKASILFGTVEEGVNYLWWVAVPRKFYRMKDGVRKDLNNPSRLEVEPGRIRIPLSAYYNDAHPGKWGEKTDVEVHLAETEASVSLIEVARRCLQDAALDREGQNLYGAVKRDPQLNQDQPQRMMSIGMSDTEYARQIQNQIDWLNSRDELKPGIGIPSTYDWVGPPIRLPRRVDGKVVDADGNPVANAKVTVELKHLLNRILTEVPDAPQSWTMTTDQQGQYEFSTDGPLLGADDILWITTEANGYPKFQTSDFERQVEYGTLPIQRIPGRRTIHGQIVDQEGNAVLKTMIRIWAIESPTTMTTWGVWDSEEVAVDERGEFSITIPKDGKALIEIVAPGFARQVLEVPDGDTDFGAVKVETGISLTGRVVDAEGKGIAGTVVAIESQPVKNVFLFYCPSSAGAKTDEEGRFTLPPFCGKCKVWVTDEAREYNGIISVNATRPNSIPVQIVDLNGDEKSKVINFRKGK